MKVPQLCFLKRMCLDFPKIDSKHAEKTMSAALSSMHRQGLQCQASVHCGHLLQEETVQGKVHKAGESVGRKTHHKGEVPEGRQSP